MKSVRCVRCDRDVEIPDDVLPQLVFHRCATRRRSRYRIVGTETLEERRAALYEDMARGDE